ncbi:MAG TPA: response regulator, partial [Sandaracinaceae bacterium LLY-WYZ-13_1]|nr:response regulator [Sandaracinaceae bacterium LLY-WYZ-13_1]
ALVRRLTELHGGHVSAHSEGLGKGTRFTVRLPATTRVEGALSPAASLPCGCCEGTSVLVVEDDADAAEMLSLVLERRGYHVSVAHDGPGALAQVSRTRPDVVLCDLGLTPAMDGYEVARRVKAEHDAPLLVALTGQAGRRARDASSDAGFDAHLVKPLEPASLEALIAARLTAAGARG